MNHHHLQTDPFKTYRRKSIAVRRAGKNTRCACGELRIEALIANTGVCARCQRRRKGQTTLDNHHVAGRRNSAVIVPIDVNAHRAELSEAQRAWPKKTLENPDDCPLLAAAGCIRGFADTVCYLINELLRWITEMLELLSELLEEQLGPQWWVNTPLNRFSKGN